jgi:predicted Ser/Thr protein kinase
MAEAPLAPQEELVLGRYRPLSPIGSGGSGSVWLARDEADGRELALKIVAREGKAGSRAEREAEAAARLRHPRCPEVIDFATDDEHVFIAYEYVPGKTLRQALRDGELDDRRTIEACAQVLDALDHAHGQGIVHRDVKPANVLIAPGERIDVRLLDFGLASFAEAETLTAVGDIPGTLAYISPERLAGDPGTAAADIWAVGVILWEALAGWHPFWNGSMIDTARKIEEGAPSLDPIRPDLPPQLIAAIDRALDPDPAARPRASALASTLRAAIAPPTRARPEERRLYPSQPPRLSPPRPGQLVHALLIGVAVAWGASLFSFYPPRAQFLLALIAGATAFAASRAGTALALAMLLLPLGNYSLGLVVVFAAWGALWLALGWREPRSSSLPLLGPLLVPLGALFLLPLATLHLRSAFRRASVAFSGVVLALLASGLEGRPLPLTGAKPPLGLGIESSRSPVAVGGALARALADRPALLSEALLLALAAALLPLARRHGYWGAALLGAGMIALALLPFSAVSFGPVVAGSWLTALALAFLPRRGRARNAVVAPVAPAPRAERRRIAV